MCKNKLFQSLGMKNKLFKVQKRKTKLMQSLEMKTIFWPFLIGWGLFQFGGLSLF